MYLPGFGLEQEWACQAQQGDPSATHAALHEVNFVQG